MGAIWMPLFLLAALLPPCLALDPGNEGWKYAIPIIIIIVGLIILGIIFWVVWYFLLKDKFTFPKRFNYGTAGRPRDDYDIRVRPQPTYPYSVDFFGRPIPELRFDHNVKKCMPVFKEKYDADMGIGKGRNGYVEDAPPTQRAPPPPALVYSRPPEPVILEPVVSEPVVLGRGGRTGGGSVTEEPLSLSYNQEPARRHPYAPSHTSNQSEDGGNDYRLRPLPTEPATRVSALSALSAPTYSPAYSPTPPYDDYSNRSATALVTRRERTDSFGARSEGQRITRTTITSGTSIGSGNTTATTVRQAHTVVRQAYTGTGV